ncbi:MBL fold metallo-hydrolase [Fructilactobacillus vespulae]|uniref:MBL fold metallo-hydrolase n=1 Tax=Fructilactobacillus vespulae TaxID=1249630 RepID=UPI0039B37405
MKLTVLGYYGGFPGKEVGTSGFLLQSDDFNLLIDCGSGVLMSLEKVIDPLQLNAVVISHYHADHFADVGVLQYYWQLHAKRYLTGVLPIYGNTLDETNFSALDWPNSTQKFPFKENEVTNIGPFKLEFLKTIHPVPAFAIKITEKKTNKMLVYTADSQYFDGLIDFCKDANLLIADTNFFENKTGTIWHMTSKQVGNLAKSANCDQLMLSHLPQTEKLNLLFDEAEAAAGAKVEVVLPKLREKIEI